MPFYTFRQNNSGGSFIGTECHIIEADNATQANHKAYQYDIYFDGCASGRDCSCCGDRWYEVYDEGDEQPKYYGIVLDTVDLDELIERDPKAIKDSFWFTPTTIEIHYADGRNETLVVTREGIEKAKELMRKVTDSCYGFTVRFDGTNSWVGSVHKCYVSDFDATKWYAKDGNNSVTRRNNKDGWANADNKYSPGLMSYTTTDRQEAVRVRGHIKTIVDRAQEAAAVAITTEVNALKADPPEGIDEKALKAMEKYLIKKVESKLP